MKRIKTYLISVYKIQQYQPADNWTLSFFEYLEKDNLKLNSAKVMIQ